MHLHNRLLVTHSYGARLPLPRAALTPWRLAKAVARLQAVYCVAAGLGALAGVMLRRGPEVFDPDPGRAATAGILVAVIGVALWVSSRSRRAVPDEIFLLGAGLATGLLAIDALRLSRGPVTSADAIDTVAQLVLLTAWLVVRVRAARALRDADRLRVHEREVARWN